MSFELKKFCKTEIQTSDSNSKHMKSTFIYFKLNFCFLLIFANISIWAQFTQTQKIASPDRESRAEFGSTLAVNDQFMVVGAPRENIAAGAAYVYKKNNDDQWIFHQKITKPEAIEMDEFASSLALQGNLLVIAAGRESFDEFNTQVGAAYIYELNSNSQLFEFSQRITASDAGNTTLFGSHITSLVIHNGKILVGAQGHNNWVGAAYLFEKVNNQWTETHKFENPEAIEWGNFGVSVAMHDNLVAIGANGADDGKGTVYLFENQNNQWQFLQALQASDLQSNNYFGTSISLNSNEIIVGAYAEGASDPSQAAVYSFIKNDNSWIENQKISSYSSDEHTYFGWICQLQNDYLFISSPHIYGINPGKILLYKKQQNQWELLHTIEPYDEHAEDFFGWHLAIHENTLVVGSPRDDFDENGQNEINDAGAIYVFDVDLMNSKEFNSSSVKIYPNPTSDWIKIQSQEKIKQTQILALNGKLIQTSNHSEISIKHLPKGIYILKILFANGELISTKIIKD